MTWSLAENYPDFSPGLRDRLMDIVLAGLHPRPQRICLGGLQAALRTIQADCQQKEPSSTYSLQNKYPNEDCCC